MKGRRKPEGPGEPFGRGFVMQKRIEREPGIVQADFRVPILLPFSCTDWSLVPHISEMVGSSSTNCISICIARKFPKC